MTCTHKAPVLLVCCRWLRLSHWRLARVLLRFCTFFSHVCLTSLFLVCVWCCRRSSNSLLSLVIPVEAAINQEAVATYKEREAKRQKLKEEQVGLVHTHTHICVCALVSLAQKLLQA